jgi:hypothetical protein
LSRVELRHPLYRLPTATITLGARTTDELIVRRPTHETRAEHWATPGDLRA